MATYLELFDLSQDMTLIKRITAGVAIAAETIRTEPTDTPSHNARVDWAKRALQNPDGAARQLVWVMLAQNSSATVAQINNATDAAIQTAIGNALGLLA